MTGHVFYVLDPPVEAFELSVLIDELSCNVILHSMSSESSPYFRVGAELIDEFVGHL